MPLGVSAQLPAGFVREAGAATECYSDNPFALMALSSLVLPSWRGAARMSPVVTTRTPGRYSDGGIAQMARAMALQAIGLGFESPYLQDTG